MSKPAFLCLVVGFAGSASALGVSENVDLSGDHANLAAAVPVVGVDPDRHGHIAVAWRFIDPLAGSDANTPGNWVCHVSISQDNGHGFRDQIIDWGLPSQTRCNAPWAAYSGRGELYVAATLTGSPPAHAAPGSRSDAAAAPVHPQGLDGVMRSRDGGRTWSATRSAISSNALDRFDTDDSIPTRAKEVPWDGARGAVDVSTGTIYISGAFPARPGGEEHSQRFFSVSTDGGDSFGNIRSFGNAAWPERWDGDIAAANGMSMASYIAESTPESGIRCPCAVVAVSRDSGKTVQHHAVADASQFDLDTLVHYPEVAADPAHAGRFAMALISADRSDVAVFMTVDAGNTWTRLVPDRPESVSSASRPAVAFSPHGVLVLAWRGVHADGSYDIYAAASSGQRFGALLRVSSASSHTPDAWLRTYAVRGDFHTSVAVSESDAHVSWADARTGSDVRAYYARIPLRQLQH